MMNTGQLYVCWHYVRLALPLHSSLRRWVEGNGLCLSGYHNLPLLKKKKKKKKKVLFPGHRHAAGIPDDAGSPPPYGSFGGRDSTDSQEEGTTEQESISTGAAKPIREGHDGEPLAEMLAVVLSLHSGTQTDNILSCPFLLLSLQKSSHTSLSPTQKKKKHTPTHNMRK